MELTHAVYPHHQVYGQYCTIQEYVDCPPEQAYDYLRQGHHLEEWTYSLRGFETRRTPGLWVGHDRLGGRHQDLLHAWWPTPRP